LKIGYITEIIEGGRMIDSKKSIDKTLDERVFTNAAIIPDLRNLLWNMAKDARLNYHRTQRKYWLGRYEAYSEIYQIYMGRRPKE